MADPATAAEVLPSRGSRLDSHMTRRPGAKSIALFLAALAGGMCFIAFHVSRDMKTVTVTSIWPYLLLALALLIALGFEFANGFLDTANLYPFA
jgi:PiT family inorganic phosphate transporter